MRPTPSTTLGLTSTFTMARVAAGARPRRACCLPLPAPQPLLPGRAGGAPSCVRRRRAAATAPAAVGGARRACACSGPSRMAALLRVLNSRAGAAGARAQAKPLIFGARRGWETELAALRCCSCLREAWQVAWRPTQRPGSQRGRSEVRAGSRRPCYDCGRVRGRPTCRWSASRRRLGHCTVIERQRVPRVPSIGACRPCSSFDDRRGTSSNEPSLLACLRAPPSARPLCVPSLHACHGPDASRTGFTGDPVQPAERCDRGERCHGAPRPNPCLLALAGAARSPALRRQQLGGQRSRGQQPAVCSGGRRQRRHAAPPAGGALRAAAAAGSGR